MDRLQRFTVILFVPLLCSIGYEMDQERQQFAALEHANSELSILKKAVEELQQRTVYPPPPGRRCASTPAMNTRESLVKEESIQTPTSVDTDPQIAANHPNSIDRNVVQSAETMAGLLANHFVMEPRDSQWSEHTEETLNHDITEALSGFSQVDSIECRTSQCRIHLIHADDEVHRLFMEQFLAAEASEEWSGASLTPTVRVLPNGRIETVTYLVRGGYSIEGIDEEEDSEP